MKIIAVIPARYESTRFPAKLLAKNTGKFLIQHTYEQVQKANLISDCLIAGDDERIAVACKTFGAKYAATRIDHQSGTDRIAEAVENIDADVIINVQADEPEIDPANIDLLANLMVNNANANMATLVAKFKNRADVANPNIVKAVIDKDNYAKYFSRAPIPYDRDAGGIGKTSDYLRHIGIYAYRKEFLMQITKLGQTKLEKIERLEQLRVLEYGFSILTGLVAHSSDGIDTPEQYADFVKREKKHNEK
ncbi:MAG: 3-deoxy-manno-octulosonate cytidylyltransferase [Anaerohalosphaeraceae bacterium]|nr:3-deoxy-manno-octulosonate cytidylyltransferase [Anaerohalosphaeraceae bacterium]